MTIDAIAVPEQPACDPHDPVSPWIHFRTSVSAPPTNSSFFSCIQQAKESPCVQLHMHTTSLPLPVSQQGACHGVAEMRPAPGKASHQP
eukprot:CAMPEP_0202896532 /NCGR_PEP_ID=MMETSP1392-20130828/5522_1 /ASSEMBLY_ACC=CAM_ASM_000868 /TAXON_ID=225041 /ORGANISM="Chlamydomonas chlamydogama, Strain SAG 11-48b" /LENGTH=88 /DNA_ID=CAMNT_0049581925 /DNA_START=108 /DNA_END=374 /DNA_ORIENTATION=+